MNRINSKLFGFLVLVLMLSFLTGISYSQSTTSHKMYSKQKSIKYSKSIQEAAESLKSKVDLTAAQTTKVEGILQDYKSGMMKNNMSTTDKMNASNKMSMKSNQAMDKIENVLTADQKTKFDNIKTEWWASTEKSLSQTTNKKMSKSSY